MKLFLFFLILSTGLQALAVETEKTKADTNREVVRTYAKVYLEAQAYEKADVMISEYLTRDPDDGNLWTLLGQTQIAEQKLAQACYSFQKASTLFTDIEDRLFANYNFADCLSRGGRGDEASLILKKSAAEEGDFTNASEHALGLMKAGVIRSGSSLPAYQKTARGRWRLSGAVGSGFDSNVLLVDEDVINNTSVSDRGSFFVTPALQAGYLGRAFGDAFDSRYLLSYTDYMNQSSRSFNSLYQRADFSFGSGPIRWGVFGDALFLNRNPFQLYDYEAGLSYMLIKQAGGDFALTYEIPVRYQKYFLDSTASSDNDRTGEGIQFKANARWIRSEFEQVGLQAIADVQYTKGKNYRLGSLDVPIVWIKDLSFFRAMGLLNTFSAELQGQYYFQSDTKRKDLLCRAGAGLIRALGTGWSLNGDFSYQKNLSTVDSAKYHKTLFSLQLSHDFL